MMQGYSLSASLPEDFGLDERFWYWRGTSGQSYIHSIYALDHCPPVAGAAFVIVQKVAGFRRAVRVGRFGSDGMLPPDIDISLTGHEIHVHLLAREPDAVARVFRDLETALETVSAAPSEARGELRPYRKPVQLELLAA